MVRVIMVVGFVLLAVSFVGWWLKVYNSPANVFDRMIATSLASPAVSKKIQQDDESQNLDQTTVLVTAPDQIVQSDTVLVQALDSDTSISTETIATPQVDYVRYTGIDTNQKSANGEAFDFSSVLGVWGKTDVSDQQGNGAQVFNQTVLGVVPIANVRQPLRRALIEQIKRDGVYRIDASKVERKTVNGRPVYSYDVTVAPVAYVTMLKNFARSIGITQLDQVNPKQYENSAPLNFVFDIDIWSGQLIKVAYEGSERTEEYSAYGGRNQIEVPTDAIDVSKLQTRLQQIQ